MVSDELSRAFAFDPIVLGKPGIPHCVVACNLDNVGAVGVEVVTDIF